MIEKWQWKVHVDTIKLIPLLPFSKKCSSHHIFQKSSFHSQKLMRNWENTLECFMGIHGTGLTLIRPHITLLLNADCSDQMEEDLLQFLPITPFINLGLDQLWVTANNLPNGVILSGHQVVLFSKLQTWAKISTSIP